jgi:hypothetical protein
MIRYSVDHIRFLEEQIAQLDKDICGDDPASGSGTAMAIVAKRAWRTGDQRCRHSSGNRNGHDAVSLGETYQLVGRNLSG